MEKKNWRSSQCSANDPMANTANAIAQVSLYHYLHRFLGHSIILKLSSQTLCLVTYSLQHVLIQVNHGWYTLHHTRFPCILFHKTNCKNPLSKSYNSHRFSNFISFPIQPIKCNTTIVLIA